MLPRQGSEDSTTPLLASDSKDDVSFYLPTTSTNGHSSNRRLNNRRKLSRETSLPSFDYDDEQNEFLSPSSTTTPLTALEEVDETPLTPSFTSTLKNNNNNSNVTPFTSSSSSTSVFRPTTISEPTTSVSWSSSAQFNTSIQNEGNNSSEISRPNSALETKPLSSDPNLNSINQIPSRNNSGGNLRRGSLVKKLSVVGPHFFFPLK